MYKNLDIVKLLLIHTLFSKRKPLPLRKLAEILGVHPNKISKMVEELEREGIVHCERIGKGIYPELTLGEMTEKLIVASEYINLLRFLDKSEVKKLLKVNFGDSVVVIFGSFGSKRYTDVSDVDILIIGGKRINLNKPYEVHFLDERSWNRMIKSKDRFISSVLKNHICINNAEKFVKGVLKWMS